jgi:hypothetical protein
MAWPPRSSHFISLECSCFFFFKFLGVGWDWVHLVRRPIFGILYQPRMIDDECGVVGGMRIGRGNQSTREKTYPSATLSTTNPTWPDLRSNQGRRGGKPANNHLSYGTAPPLECIFRGYVKQVYVPCEAGQLRLAQTTDNCIGWNSQYLQRRWCVQGLKSAIRKLHVLQRKDCM